LRDCALSPGAPKPRTNVPRMKVNTNVADSKDFMTHSSRRRLKSHCNNNFKLNFNMV
jgi:hypothetical protein